MSGTFNGIRRVAITSINTVKNGFGLVWHSFRVLGNPISQLERTLQLNAAALLIMFNLAIDRAESFVTALT